MKKHIIITGASSGFGAEMAKLFAKDEHNITLLARRTSMIEDLKIEGAFIKKVDVTNFEEFDGAVKAAIEKFGPVDLLVNNAGVMQLGQMGTQDKKEYDTMIDVNIKGVANGIETVISDMRKRKTGTIVNISSIAGLKAFSNHIIYCGTKFAVRGISEGLRQEVASDNVRVTNVSPGAFATELLSKTNDQTIIDNYNEWKKTMGDMPHPSEVAKVVKYIFDAPQSLNIREVTLAPTKQVS